MGLVALCLGLSASGVDALDNRFGVTDCECYRAEDCDSTEPDDWICRGYKLCGGTGKLDGTCLAAPVSPPWSPELLSEALTLYFEAYAIPISSGEGRPDPDLLAEAQDVQLSQVQHDAVKETVHLALDAVIGFDFDFPARPGRSSNAGNSVDPFVFGNIRGTPAEAAAIVEAARVGMVEAILTRNLNAVAEPLEDFWAAHPDFHPHHTGRLYAHGHAQYDGIAPLDAQIDHLKRFLRHLLTDGSPLCGDNKTEGLEECDGADDSACPQVCSWQCECGSFL
ncbi:MAG TPA: hypothetical protein VFB62_09545 [Polyangiaceae bacterium]|nr:hypothetical protein [Polyangiaceae bacterium]